MRERKILILLLLVLPRLCLAIIHGDIDNRSLITQNSPSKIIDLSQSVAAMIEKGSDPLRANSLEERFNLCTNQNFHNLPTISKCSGFLIGKSKLMTAAHCIRTQKDCDQFYWAFNYEKSATNISEYSSESYSCKRIIHSEKNYLTGVDYTIIELEREVRGRSPLLLETKKMSEMGEDQLVMIGHPVGLPKVVVEQGEFLSLEGHNLVATNFDANAGMSGAPVINLVNSKVVGMMLRGPYDFDTDLDSENFCRTWYKCSDYPTEECLSEDVLRIDKVVEEQNRLKK